MNRFQFVTAELIVTTTRNLPTHDPENIEKGTKQIEQRCGIFGRKRNVGYGAPKICASSARLRRPEPTRAIASA
jgi:hypothetical protein